MSYLAQTLPTQRLATRDVQLAAPAGDDQDIAILLKSSALTTVDAVAEVQAAGITMYAVGIGADAVGADVAYS